MSNPANPETGGRYLRTESGELIRMPEYDEAVAPDPEEAPESAPARAKRKSAQPETKE
jgi:hypothetical protein